MICPTCRGRQFVAQGGADDDEGAEHVPCPDCIGGIASCCDAAGSAMMESQFQSITSPSFTCPRCGAVSYNPNDIRERYCGRCHAFVDDPAGSRPEGPSEAEIERSQARIGAILEASYRDDTFPERLCDRCGGLYRGPAVYCSLKCALEDA